MKRATLRRSKYRPFTADTGHSLDWQIGFEDPYFMNFLGIGTSEKERRAALLSQIRTNYYPSPDSCTTASDLLPMPKGGWKNDATWERVPCGSPCEYVEKKLDHLRKDIAEAQRKIEAGEGSKDVVPRYLEAFNTLLGEYMAYYNSNCLGSASPGLSENQMSASNATANSQTTIVAGLNPSTGNGINNNGSTPATTSKSMPKWVWFAGGGVLLTTAIVLILKKKT